jgi:hypothetical protein
MTILLTGAGGLFTRLGAIAGGLNEHNTARGATLNARVATVRGQYQAAQQDVMDDLYARQLSWQATDDWATKLKGMAQDTLTRMARDDGWAGSTFADALDYLRVQMVGAGTMLNPDFSINKPTVTVSPAAAAGMVGNGTLRASVVNPLDGLTYDQTLAEALSVVCTSHSYTGGSAVAGREGFAVVGAVRARNDLAYEWPAGSAANGILEAASPDPSMVTDGAFEVWVGNVPTNWNVTTGPGTVTKSVAPYTGTAALRITGDGATLTRFEQTLANLQPQRAYPINWWMVKNGAGLAAGTLRVRLVDAANAVINDEAGTPNEVTVALPGLPNVNWGPTGIQGGWFRTPRIMPSVVKIEWALTVAITAAQWVDIDRLSLPEADQAYPGGPLLKAFSGSVPFAVKDTFVVTTTNNHNTTKFSRELDRLWDLRQNGVRVPSEAVGTVSDALIV